MAVLLSIYYTIRTFILKVHLKQELKPDFQPRGVLWTISTGFPRVIKATADVNLQQHFCQKTQTKGKLRFTPSSSLAIPFSSRYLPG